MLPGKRRSLTAAPIKSLGKNPLTHLAQHQPQSCDSSSLQIAYQGLRMCITDRSLLYTTDEFYYGSCPGAPCHTAQPRRRLPIVTAPLVIGPSPQRAVAPRSLLCAPQQKKELVLANRVGVESNYPFDFLKNKPQLYASKCLLLIITNSFWMRCIIRAKPCTIHEHLECRMRSSHTAQEG